jgi:hypothetical protein
MLWSSPERYSAFLCYVLPVLCVKVVGLNESVSLGLDSVMGTLPCREILHSGQEEAWEDCRSRDIAVNIFSQKRI